MLVFVLATSACAPVHAEPGEATVTRGECYSCHQADYARAMSPPHTTFPTTCESCHVETSWWPATGGGHPQTSFPIDEASPHFFGCTSCHDASRGPDAEGANTDCVNCHVGAHHRAAMDLRHAGMPEYPTGDAPPNFCLDCHATGIF